MLDITTAKLLKNVAEKDYADDLMKVIHSGGNIEEFIVKLEAQQREAFIQTGLAPNKKAIQDASRGITESEANIAKLEHEKQIALEIKRRVDGIKATYPQNKQYKLDSYLSQMLSDNKTKTIVVRGRVENDNPKNTLTQQPKGIIDRIKYGRSIQKGNEKLEELIAYCEQHNVRDYTTDSVVRKAVKGQDIESNIDTIDKNIAQQMQKRQNNIDEVMSNEKTIATKISKYDSEQHVPRQLIVEFSTLVKSAINQSVEISKEEIATSGLSEEFIAKHIMSSKCPDITLRSIKRSYENLDRPAAPMVAISSNKRANTDDVLNKLKQKGFDVVFETDERAKDPNVFVVDKKNNAIYAPFLAPDEALKANIAMIDAIHECGGIAMRSSPRTRESFTVATHQSIGKPADDTGCAKINLETIACIHSKERYDEVMNSFVDYQRMYDVMINNIQNDNPERFEQLAMSLNEKTKPYLDSGSWTTENANNLAKDFVKEHREDFMPHIQKHYQNTMLKEALDNAIDPHIPNAQNLQMLKDGKAPTSVFHGGKNGAMPYSVLAKEKNMCHLYAATTLAEEVIVADNGREGVTGGAYGYATGKSSHNKKVYDGTRYDYAFAYEYESRGEKQQLERLDGVTDYTGKFDKKELIIGGTGADETIVLPHQNKLKKVYIVVETSNEMGRQQGVFPLELDKDGNIADKKWRDFVELHNPVDDTVEGFMVDRQNNMIADYDTNGKEKMMDRRLNLSKTNEDVVLQNVSQSISAPTVNFSDDRLAALSGRKGTSAKTITQPETTVIALQTIEQAPVQQVQEPVKVEPTAPKPQQQKASIEPATTSPKTTVAEMTPKEKVSFFKSLRKGVNTLLSKVSTGKEKTTENQTTQQSKTNTQAQMLNRASDRGR